MKTKLRNYFYDRLSAKEEEKVQKYICENQDSEELDEALRSLFDECIEASRPQPHRHIRRFVRLPYVMAAAAACLALLIAIPISYRSGQTVGEKRIASIEWVEETVPFGEQKSLTLCDGTQLHLNAGSRLTYPKVFSGDTRTIFMNGEAFLDVAKDPEHPFIIKSQDIAVKVLGTSFNFRNYANERNAELLLLEGSVEASVAVNDEYSLVRLKPGDKMRYDRTEGKIDIDRFIPKDYKAFYQDNSLHFNDMQLSDIASELSRRFNCQIVITDEKLASRRYFSIFTNNETLDDILAAMNSDGKMRIRRSGDIVYLQSK